MTVVVINQPSIFPWLGELHKMRVADLVVWLDDAQRQKGGFSNRYRMASGQAPRWLTIPCRKSRLATRIGALQISSSVDWRSEHVRKLNAWYRDAPERETLLELVCDAYAAPSLQEMQLRSIRILFAYFSWRQPALVLASTLGVSSTRSRRLVEIIEATGGTTYLFGPGRGGLENHYLDQRAFFDAGIPLQLMNYESVDAAGGLPGIRLSAMHELAHRGQAAAAAEPTVHPMSGCFGSWESPAGQAALGPLARTDT